LGNENRSMNIPGCDARGLPSLQNNRNDKQLKIFQYLWRFIDYKQIE